MPRSLYDLLPAEVQQAHPREALSPRAAKVLLAPGLVPDDADPGDIEQVAGMVAQRVPGWLKQDKSTQDWLTMRRTGGEMQPMQATRPPGAPVDPRVLAAASARTLVEQSRNPLTRAAVSFGEGLPSADQAPRGSLLPAQTPLEHIGDVAGSVGAFALPAGLLTPVVGPAAAAGITAAMQRGTPKERAIRFAANAAGAGLASKASSAILSGGMTPAARALTQVLGDHPSAVREVASHLPGAAVFGGGVPLAEAVMSRLTGEKNAPLPGPKEWATGAGDMLVVGLVSMATGRAMSPQARTAFERAPESVRAHAEAVARAVAPPRGYTVPKQEAEGLRQALVGKTVMLDVPGGLGRGAAKVRGVIVYRSPAGDQRIHLLVSDPQGAVMAPVTFNSTEALVSAVGRLPQGEQRAEVPDAEVARNLPEGRVERSAAEAVRLTEVEAKMSRLEKSNPGKGDKDYRRWAQRVAKLTAERDALKATGAKLPPPSPAPVVPEAKPVAVAPPEKPVEQPKPVVPKRGPEVSPVQGSGTAAPEAPKAAPPAPPKAAPPVDRGAVGKEGVEHPPSEHFAVAQMLSHTGAAKDLARMSREGGTVDDVRRAIRTLWAEGGDGQQAFGVDKKGEPVMTYTDRATGKKVSVGLDRMAEVAHRELGVPEPKAPAAPPTEAPKPKMAEGPPEGSRFVGGESVRVPNYTNRGHDKRPTVTGEVIGHTTVKDAKGVEEPGVVVWVKRGGSGTQHELPERVVKKMPTNESRAAAKEKRKASQKKLRAAVEAKVGGDPDKARSLITEYEDKAGQVFDKYGDGVTDPAHPDYAKARRAWRAAVDAAETAKDVLAKLEAPEGGTFDLPGEKPLEQGRLGGMPAPKIPGGAKRSAFDESADIVAGMKDKPAPPKQGNLLDEGVSFSPDAIESPVRYDPSTDKYSGDGLKNGDLLTDGTDVLRVTRRSGFTVEVDKRTDNGWKVGGSRSVDPTSPDYRGDLRPYHEDVNESRPLSARGTGRAAKASPKRPATTTPEVESPGDHPAIPKNTRTLPKAPIPLPAGAAVSVKKSLAQAIGDGWKSAMEGIASRANPLSLVSARDADILMDEKGRVDRGTFRTHRQQRNLRKFWNKRTPEEVGAFWQAFESGGQMHEALRDIAEFYRKRGDNLFRAIAHYKDIPYYDNWFPHMWKDRKAAEKFFAGRRPMEGNKSFTKNRIHKDMAAGMAADLEPVSMNPEVIMQLAEHNVRKFVMVQRLKKRLLAAGSLKFVRVGTKPPEGFASLDQRWAKVYMPPTQAVTEHFDKLMMDGLRGVAKAIGAKYLRAPKVGGQRLGYSQAAPGTAGKIVTKSATPLSVLAHEIGHAIDSKYGMRAPFLHRGGGFGRVFNAELDQLAALRYEGQAPTKAFKSYAHSGAEKMAVMMEAWVHAPQRFKEVAPNVYREFTDFMGKHADTKGVLDLKPGLVYGSETFDVHAGGVVLGGEYYAEKNLARVLDNHMSKDLLMDTALGKTAMESRNVLNAAQLGLSGFHFSNLTYISGVNRASIGVRQLLRGDRKGFMTLAKSWAAPGEYLREGRKFYNLDPGMSQLERDIFTGGGKLASHDYYDTSHMETFLDKSGSAEATKGLVRFLRGDRRGLVSVRQALRAANAKGALKAAPRAALEATQALVGAYAERLKVGAFQELMADALERNANKLSAGVVTRETLARQSWTTVEARLGLLNYDNMFWNRTLRTAVQLAFRAPGWRWGTVHQLYGSVIDTGKAAVEVGKKALGKGGSPEFTDKMAFTLTAYTTQLAIGGVLMALWTGRRPETYEDYRHPKNGQVDDKGNEIRIDLPTDIKTFEGWNEGMSFIARGRGTRTFVSRSGLSPLFSVGDVLNNEDYRGKHLYPVDSGPHERIVPFMKWAFGTVTPFSMGQGGEIGGENPTAQKRVEAFFGVTRHRPTNEREYIRVPKNEKKGRRL